MQKFDTRTFQGLILTLQDYWARQALGDIQLANAGLFFQRTNIKNTFVRHATIATGIEHRVSIFQPGSDIVGVENRLLVARPMVATAKTPTVYSTTISSRWSLSHRRTIFRSCTLVL